MKVFGVVVVVEDSMVVLVVEVDRTVVDVVLVVGIVVVVVVEGGGDTTTGAHDVWNLGLVLAGESTIGVTARVRVVTIVRIEACRSSVRSRWFTPTNLLDRECTFGRSCPGPWEYAILRWQQSDDRGDRVADEYDESAHPFIGLLPTGSSLDAKGTLRVGGCSLVDLAKTFGTPLYVLDETALRTRAQEFRAALSSEWGRGMVYFASKAFPASAMYQLMAEEGVGADVAGAGELVMALKGGILPENVLLHGNAKTSAELSMALEVGVGTIVIDNFDDIDRLEQLAQHRQNVLIRVIPGVKPRTHDAIATGQHGSKFGLARVDALEAIRRVRASKVLRLEGLHVHIGSQIADLEPFAEAVESISSLGEFETYDLGGGLAERYSYVDTVPTPGEWVAALASAAMVHLPRDARLLIEPGRSMVARSGLTLYRAITVKHGEPTFVALDGGMGDNLEVSLYGQRFEASVVERLGDGPPVELVGHHCESGDVLVSGARLCDPRVGDVVAVAVTGAYCFTMANNYNGALRPPVVFCRDGVASLRVRRETFDDLVRRDAP